MESKTETEAVEVLAKRIYTDYGFCGGGSVIAWKLLLPESKASFTQYACSLLQSPELKAYFEEVLKKGTL